MKLKSLIVLLLVVFSSVAYPQGSLKGKVTDGKEPLPFVNISILKDGKIITSALSDLEGYYFMPIAPGKYDVKATFIGYNKNIISGIMIKNEMVSTLDIQLDKSISKMDTVKRVFSSINEGIVENDFEEGEYVVLSNYRMDTGFVFYDWIFVGARYSLPKDRTVDKQAILNGIPAKFENASEYDDRTNPWNNSKTNICQHIETKKTSPVQNYINLLISDEINDSIKSILWKCVNRSEVEKHIKARDLFSKNKYCVQITNLLSNPISGASVILMDKNNTRIWYAQTDSTGKAYLWSNPFDVQSEKANQYTIEIIYQGRRNVIENPITIVNGINSIKLN